MSDFRKLVDQVANGKRVDEVAPPGFKGTAKALKKHSDEVDNPFALAWWMKNKGYNSHKKANGSPKNEVKGAGKATQVSLSDESMGNPVSVDGGQNSVFTGPNAGLTPEDMQNIEMGEDGRGAPYDVNVAADPMDTNSYVESITVDHPQKGRGTVLEINETNIVVEWDNLQLSILGPERVPFSEAKYLFRVDERYSDDPDEVEIDGHKKKKKLKKKDKRIKEGGLAAELPETSGELAACTSHDGSDWTPGLQDDPDDSPDVTDFQAPKDGANGIKSVVRDGVRDDMRGKAHKNDNRSGTRAKVHSTEGKQTMTKKTQLDEHMIAIQGTYRGKTNDFGDMPKLDLTMNDLLEYSVPEPEDSVLTTGDQAGNEKIAPLSTEAGASAAHDSPYPDGDMADDTPEDAPGTPDYDNIDDGGNEREAATGVEPSADVSGSSSSSKSTSSDSYDYSSSDSSSDSDDTDKDEEKDEMDESILSWEDIGLQLDECGCDGGDEMGMGMADGRPSMTNEDDGEGGGVSMSRDLLDRLLKDIRDQQPDDDKLGYICSGIEAAASEKGSELGVEDIQMIMGEIKEAFSGQDVDNDGDVGAEPVDNAPDAGQQDDGYADDEGDSPNSVGNEDEGYEFEDKAEGDGEPAGPEGGEEHEGKTKLMDKDDVEETVGASGPTGGFGNEKNSKKIKPVNQNTSKGSGPGGGSSGNYGQDGSIPAVASGSERATPGAPLDKEGGGHTVAPISESRVDENMVAVGMAAIGGVMRYSGNGPDIDPADPDAEIKMIRRRAGLENWWKI